ncbi:chromosomal replication initiator protein DnaA [Candidatus Microgenomates bacterium]|nr:chromosomal replication initiator protein DnaA [Candidatus Microgenomates bacterium]
MNKRDLWKTTLDELEITLTKANFQTWFPLTFVNKIEKKENNRQIIEIATPSPFAAENIEIRYYHQIKEILDKKTGKKNELIFTVKRPIRQSTDKDQRPKLGPLFEKKKVSQEKVRSLGLKEDFTFENFAVSSSNQIAYAAATAVAKSPGKAYNPLFLYGGVGVGKTHLMQAITHKIIKNKPLSHLIYCTSEEFTNDFINSLRIKSTDIFRQKYRRADILLIDDVQFFGGKEKVQEELFHTFNTIHQKRGQIVLTSDRQPREIKSLEDRLRSRFEGGLAIDIQSPDFELRCAILLIKAKQQEINLPMDSVKLIASNIEDTRRLEGFLIRLITEAKLKEQSITPGFVNALLGRVSEPKERKVVRPKEALEVIADHFNVKLSQIKGERRLKKFVLPRQILMYLLRHDLRMNLMEIGEFLGGRDHTTVMYGVEKITRELPNSEDLRVTLAEIKKRLYN